MKGNEAFVNFTNLKEEFIALGSSDYMIMSPSSFAFWANVLGNRPKAIFSSAWINYKIEKNDTFWTKYIENNKFGISIHKCI